MTLFTRAMRWRLPHSSSLRRQLLILVLLPLLLLTGTVILLAARWSTDYTYAQLFTKVNTDLRVANDLFQRIQSDRRHELEYLANSSLFLAALESGDTAALNGLLDTQRSLGGFDFLNLLDSDVDARLSDSGWEPWQLHRSALTDSVLRGTSAEARPDAAHGIEIYPADAWHREAPELRAMIMLDLIDTPYATPTTRKVEDRAMVIRVLQRVHSVNGSVLGLLEGGLLLNRNFVLVDEIRDLVYGPGSLAAGSRGTVTVFLDDVRISTNVPGNNADRALGTRVSADVRHTVLDKGEHWIDRAFVVNDWYISAYQPIIDVNDERVGILYAGYLEAPFRAATNRAITLLAVVVVGGMLLAGVTATLGARQIFRPIETIAAVARAVAGDTSIQGARRIGPLARRDEIGALATQFDSMLDTLEQHRARIEHDAGLLERKVADRTVELETQNRRLRESIDLLHETRRQLAEAEKFAALGELTAGVAHEINNPTAVILGNMDVLIDRIGNCREQVGEEIDLIIEQVYRIRSITDRLLQYSRAPSDNPGSSVEPVTEPIDVDVTVDDGLLLTRHELDRRQVHLSRGGGGAGQVMIDPQELQQVLVNLVINAIEAVPEGGRIDVRTDRISHRTETDCIRITVADNGAGIEPSHLPRLFDPFFTSGKPAGTGLGLSVSYGIVSRARGTIDVDSSPSKGAVFRVTLPAADGGSSELPDSVSELPISMLY